MVVRCAREPLGPLPMLLSGGEQTTFTLCPYPSQQVLGWSTWGNPAFNVLLCQKKIKPQTRANFCKTGLVFQDLNAMSEPKDLVELYVSPFGLCNAFSPFLAIWRWAQRSGYESCLCFQSLQYRLCWKPLSQSRAAQMVLGEVSVPLV